MPVRETMPAPFRPPLYCLLTCGVDFGQDAPPLTYAVKDAVDFRRTMIGALGPIDDRHAILLKNVTKRQLREALQRVANLRPTYFVFFFSGHGSEVGILTADGILTHAELRGWIKAIKAPHSLVLLDACHAGAYLTKSAVVSGLHGLTDDWLTVLGNATPSNRVICATGADRASAEGGAVENGHFTWTLLRVLESKQADLRWNGTPWMSDELVYNAVRRQMLRLFGNEQVPVARRLTADFPLVRSQEAIIGAGALRADLGPDYLRITARLIGRRLLPTIVRYEALNPIGGAIAEGQMILLAEQDDEASWFDVQVPAAAICQDMVCRLYGGGGPLPFRWAITLEDQHHRQLARRVFETGWQEEISYATSW